MPVANCIVSSKLSQAGRTEPDRLVSDWANEAGLTDQTDEMTINVIVSETQHGKAYPVMAWLYLPSLWSAEDVERLQVGLSKALGTHFRVRSKDVLIVTSVTASGSVVEHGRTVTW